MVQAKIPYSTVIVYTFSNHEKLKRVVTVFNYRL